MFKLYRPHTYAKIYVSTACKRSSAVQLVKAYYLITQAPGIALGADAQLSQSIITSLVQGVPHTCLSVWNEDGGLPSNVRLLPSGDVFDEARFSLEVMVRWWMSLTEYKALKVGIEQAYPGGAGDGY
jgi:hypothetical protein